MNYLLKVKIFLLVLFSVAFTAHAQRTVVKGIVLDSMTLKAMGGVSVKLKNTTRGTITDPSGIFTLTANDYDTLLFSSVGFVRVIRAIYPDDEIMMVRMQQDVIILKEVTVLGKSLRGNDLPTLKLKSNSMPWYGAMPSSSGAGAAVNMAYFSKLEREKRKLSKVLVEQQKARAYVFIVTNPELKTDFMQRFSISEDRFYSILAQFNQLHRDVVYSSNEGIILNALVDFFQTTVDAEK